MPTYDHACPICGPFTAVKKLVDFDQPAACPVCGRLADRRLGIPDSLFGLTRRARNGTADGDPTEPTTDRYARLRHGAGGCGCCPA